MLWLEIKHKFKVNYQAWVESHPFIFVSTLETDGYFHYLVVKAALFVWKGLKNENRDCSNKKLVNSWTSATLYISTLRYNCFKFSYHEDIWKKTQIFITITYILLNPATCRQCWGQRHLLGLGQMCLCRHHTTCMCHQKRRCRLCS